MIVVVVFYTKYVWATPAKTPAKEYTSHTVANALFTFSGLIRALTSWLKWCSSCRSGWVSAVLFRWWTATNPIEWMFEKNIFMISSPIFSITSNTSKVERLSKIFFVLNNIVGV